MPHSPLSRLRPRDFPKIGDEENAFDSNNEDTDDEPEQVTEKEDPSEDPENENEAAILLPNESGNCCRLS